MTCDQILARCPGITYRQLDTWVTKGWLNPDERNPGPGHARRFTGDEARVAIVMGRLVAAGLKPDAAHRVARGQWELAPGITVLVDREDSETRAIRREALLIRYHIRRGTKAKRRSNLRAALKVGAHR